MKTRQKRLSVVLSQQLREQNARQAKRTKLAYVTSGQIVARDNTRTGIIVFVPAEYSAVRFSCKGRHALFPSYTCFTKSSGSERSDIRYGTPFTVTDVDVPLSTSGCEVELSFITSDSTGGFANWKLIK